MAHVSFALLQAHLSGASFEEIAARLDLTEEFVEERVEAARLCLLIPAAWRSELH